jgi:hypothetical protein
MRNRKARQCQSARVASSVASPAKRKSHLIATSRLSKRLAAMKPLFFLFLLFCFLPGSATAALPPDDVAGVRWGANLAAVRQIFSKRGDVALDAETPGELKYKGGEFVGEVVEAWRFEFPEGRFTKANIRFERPPGRNEEGKLYSDVVFGRLHQLLKRKYGSPKESADRDHRHSTWLFPSPSAPGALKKIVLNIRWSGSDPRVDLTYIDLPAPKPGAPKPSLDDEF